MSAKFADTFWKLPTLQVFWEEAIMDVIAENNNNELKTGLSGKPRPMLKRLSTLQNIISSQFMNHLLLMLLHSWCQWYYTDAFLKFWYDLVSYQYTVPCVPWLKWHNLVHGVSHRAGIPSFTIYTSLNALIAIFGHQNETKENISH